MFFVLGVILGKEVPVQQIDDSNYTEIMKSAGLPDFVVTILVDIQRSIPEGSLDVESNDFGKILGRPDTPIKRSTYSNNK